MSICTKHSSRFCAAEEFASASHHSSMLLQVGSGKVVKVTGVQGQGRTSTVLLRGSNKLVLEEAEVRLFKMMPTCAKLCLELPL